MNHPKEDLLNDLIRKTSKISKDLVQLKLIMPSSQLSAKVSLLKEKFEFLQMNWKSLALTERKKIKENFQKNREKIKKIKKVDELGSSIVKRKKRIKSQEIVVERKEKLATKSFRKVKKWWRNSLSDMESSSGLQNEIVERISQDNLERYEKMEEEFGTSFTSFMLRSSNEKTWRCEKGEKNDFLKKSSNFNPFLNSPDDIESFRFNKKSVNHAKVLGLRTKNEIDNETFHDSVNLQEVKKALHILKKAKLLDNKGNSALLKIAEMMKNPENSSNFELVLQLIELENQKNQPETKNFKIKEKKSFFDREASFFESSLEDSITKGLLSADHPINSDRVYDDRLRDVDLDEILKVESIHEQIELLPASDSFWEELNRGILLSQDDSKLDNRQEHSLNDFPVFK